MSVKTEKEAVEPVVKSGAAAMAQGLRMIKDGKNELVHDLGVAITGGKSSVGESGYLTVCE